MLARTFRPAREHLFETCDLPLRRLEMVSNAAEALIRCGFATCKAFVSCFSAWYVSRNPSMKASWSVPASAMVESPSKVGCRSRVSYTRGGSVSLAKCGVGDRGDEVVGPRLGSDPRIGPGSGSPSGSAASMPQHEQLLACPQREDRLAMAVLVCNRFSVRPSARSALMASFSSGRINAS